MTKASLSTLFAGIIASQIIAGAAAAGGIDPKLGAFVTLGKNYVIATVEGAAKGLEARGWSNASMQGRIALQVAKQGVETRAAISDIRNQALSEALSGKWSEEALEGYIQALEAPIAQWRALAVQARDLAEAVDRTRLNGKRALSAQWEQGAAPVDWYRAQAMARGMEVELDAIAIADAYEADGSLPDDYRSGDLFLMTAARRQDEIPFAPPGPVEADLSVADLDPMR